MLFAVVDDDDSKDDDDNNSRNAATTTTMLLLILRRMNGSAQPGPAKPRPQPHPHPYPPYFCRLGCCSYVTLHITRMMDSDSLRFVVCVWAFSNKLDVERRTSIVEVWMLKSKKLHCRTLFWAQKCWQSRKPLDMLADRSVDLIC